MCLSCDPLDEHQHSLIGGLPDFNTHPCVLLEASLPIKIGGNFSLAPEIQDLPSQLSHGGLVTVDGLVADGSRHGQPIESLSSK